MKKSKRYCLFSGLAVILLVVIDQITKFLAVFNLKDNNSVAIIEDVFELKYLENQSAAFGSDVVTLFQKIFKLSYFDENPAAFLRAKMIFFLVLTFIVVVLVAIWFTKIPSTKKFRLLNVLLVVFIAGAIGNFIDRLVNNYVVDFLYFKLINFPIFNVADIYVTLSVIAFIFLLLFGLKEDDFKEISPFKKKKIKDED